MEKNSLVEWDERYSVGIQPIDEQHRELFKLVKNFYLGCMTDDGSAKTNFMLMIRPLINYIKYHFAAEEELLGRIKYPDIAAHSRQHAEFIRTILEQIESFEQGRAFSLKNFARHIRDWILTHEVLIDKKYATYIHFVNSQVNGRPMYGPQAMALPGRSVAEAEGPSELFLG